MRDSTNFNLKKIAFAYKLRLILPIHLLTQLLFAQQTPPVLVYSDSTQRIETSPYAAVLEDVNAEWTIEEVRTMPDSAFHLSKMSRLNFGNTASRFWVRFYVDNKTNEDLFFFNFVSMVNYLDLFAVSKEGRLTVFPPSGTMRPFKNRDMALPKIAFNIGKNAKTLFVAVKSNQSLTFTNFIGSKDAIYGFMREDERVSFFMVGFCFILGLYNFIIYLNSRDTPFLWYSVYELGVIWYFFYISGYGYEFFWQRFPNINADSNICLVLAVTGVTLFSMTFLNTRNALPRYHLYLQVLLGVFLSGVLLQLLGFIQLANTICQLSVVLIYVSLCAVGWVMLFKKHRTARFYVVGWTIYLVIIIMYMLAEAGIVSGLHDIIFNYHLLNVSVTAEGCFLAFALADRVREIRQQARDAQQLLLNQAQEYEALVEKHNHLLETPPSVKNDSGDAAKHLEALIVSLRTERDMIRKISIPTLEGIILLPMSDLVRIEALGSYAIFHLSSGKKITASRPIGDFEEALPKTPFFRTHKSHIVNLNCVERYIRGDGGSVVLQGGVEIGVSRAAKAELLSRLQIA